MVNCIIEILLVGKVLVLTISCLSFILSDMYCCCVNGYTEEVLVALLM